MLLMLIS